MKTIYQKPETKVVLLKTQHQLLAGSDIAVGNAYSTDDVVLSRRADSLWEDEE